MTEMDGEYLGFEFLHVNYDEICSLLVPGYHVLVDVVLNRNGNYLKDLIGFGDKNGRAGSFLFSPSGSLVQFLEVL